MATVFFDITDVVQFSRRSNRLNGIQRVAFNLINILARKHGREAIRCIFFHPNRRGYVQFDPAAHSVETEFDAEWLLIDLGLSGQSSRYPSKVRIKSYLRAHARNKWQRAWLKARIYAMAWMAPGHLAKLDLAPTQKTNGLATPLNLQPVTQLPSNGHLVHLGSSWFFPEAWRFASAHKSRAGMWSSMSTI